jgi:hypothetical protein
MPNRVALILHLESMTQQLPPNLVALQDAAKLGFDAIERDESLTLRTNQNIVDFVQQAGLKAKTISTDGRIGRSAT